VARVLLKQIVLVFVLVAACAALVGCAAGDPRYTAEAPAGFWVGLWHGVISWVSLVVGVFVEGVAVYEAHNSGGWYDFGFLFGALLTGRSAVRGEPAR
jgi:hypothetical protein